MIDAKELKELNDVGKKILNKSTFKKIKTIKEKEEKIHALKYAIISSLKIKYHDLEKKVKKMKQMKKDVFFAETRLNLLRSKIKFFEATFYKKDFKVVDSLFKKVELEVKYV